MIKQLYFRNKKIKFKKNLLNHWSLKKREKKSNKIKWVLPTNPGSNFFSFSSNGNMWPHMHHSYGLFRSILLKRMASGYKGTLS